MARSGQRAHAEPGTRPAIDVSIGRRLVYACVVVVLFFALFELLAWLARPLYDPQEPSRVLSEEEQKLAEIHLLDADVGPLPRSLRVNLVDNVLAEPHPLLMFHVRPNPGGAAIHHYTHINALGYRGPEFPAASRDETASRVMSIGDSCAFGWTIKDYELTIQGQLEQRLQDLPDRYEVYNLGQPGYSTAQGRVLFEEWFPRIDPDVLIVYFGWNDARPRAFLTDAQYLNTLRQLNNPIFGAVRRSNLYRALAALLGRNRQPLAVRYAPADASNRRVPIRESVANFEAFVTAADARDARVIVILPPHAEDLVEKIFSVRIVEQNAAVAQALEGRGEILELARMEYTSSDASSYFSLDGYHPNERGAAYIADALLQVIRDGSDSAQRNRAGAMPKSQMPPDAGAE